jgi:hypothetical protein
VAEQENRNSLVVLDAKEDCREDTKAFKGVNRAREAIIPGKSGFGVGFQSPSRLRTEVGDERCPADPTCHGKKGGTRLSVGQEEGKGKKTPATAGLVCGLGRRGKKRGAGCVFFLFCFL